MPISLPFLPAQIYMLLADQDGEDPRACLSHIQKALTLVSVLQKSNPSESIVRLGINLSYV